MWAFEMRNKEAKKVLIEKIDGLRLKAGLSKKALVFPKDKNTASRLYKFKEASLETIDQIVLNLNEAFGRKNLPRVESRSIIKDAASLVDDDDMRTIRIPPSLRGPLTPSVESVEILPKWDPDNVVSAFASPLKNALNEPLEEDIYLLSTYYPEPELGTLLTTLSALGERLRNTPSSRYRPNITIFFFSPKLPTVINTRFRGFVDPPNFKKLADDGMAAFLAIKSQYIEEMSLNVRYYTSWPFGHCYIFGKRVIYLSILLPDNQALTGPMIVLRDSNSMMWKALEHSMKTSLSHSQSCSEPTPARDQRI